MIVVGLTGSIATGKSTIVKRLTELGIHVHDADECVHEMFSHNEQVIEDIRKLWPECITGDGVDRNCLRQKVLRDPKAIKELEGITHPIVRKLDEAFLAMRKASGDEAVFLDIPLLYETGRDKDVDCTLVVYCAPEEQRRRVLDRGVDPALFEYLLNLQIPLHEKIKQADYTLSSDGTLAETRIKLIEILHQIEKRFGIHIIRGQDA
jgi:dephospho-CoA kinase